MYFSLFLCSLKGLEIYVVRTESVGARRLQLAREEFAESFGLFVGVKVRYKIFDRTNVAVCFLRIVCSEITGGDCLREIAYALS